MAQEYLRAALRPVRLSMRLQAMRWLVVTILRVPVPCCVRPVTRRWYITLREMLGETLAAGEFIMGATGNERVTASRRHAKFTQMLHALACPHAFPFDADIGRIEIIQTHASAVLLAGNRAYKLKKPNDFGFFDYSTPALRRHYCGEEVRLNTRLAPHVYLGVAPVLSLVDGSYRFAPVCEADATPAPGDQLDDGRVVDYAVVMVRLPEAATLEARVRADNVRPEQLVAVAERMASFHASSRTDEDVAHFGRVEVIQHNWDENFEQMAPYVGRALDAETYGHLRTYVETFLRQRRPLFETRRQTGRIRDCHGDLRMQHVYFLNQYASGLPSGETLDAQTSLAIIDCIEFNERFRYGDVAAEIAFLTMELDAVGRPDFARAFTDAYVAKTGDESLRELLPFYACYRACVRGKVLAFQLDEPEVPPDQREEARRQAQLLFTLAGRYASAPAVPVLLLVGGAMGVGKTTLARGLSQELGWEILSSDVIRKELAGVSSAELQDVPYGQGIYTKSWSERTYRDLQERAGEILAAGRSVILDASFGRRLERQAAAQLAATVPVQAWFIECTCPREIALVRLAHRWRIKQDAGGTTRPPATSRPGAAARDASDGRPELYDAQLAAWQPFDPATEPGLVHLRVNTQGNLAISVAQVVDRLGIEQLACWL